MVKYLGSKRTLLPVIGEVVGCFPEATSALDLFSGTSRVGHSLKARGLKVSANDLNAYAHCLATCYIEADAEDYGNDISDLLSELNSLPGSPGYFTETFCRKSRFFTPENGARIDAIRERIAKWKLDWEIEAVLLTSLLEAADRVDSTTGVQMAYLKDYAPRALNPLELKMPRLIERAVHGKGKSYMLDALDAARTLDADIAYVDPPYNQHSYLGNYHVWESLVLWDKPDVYGIACKRVDVRDRASRFNSKRLFKEAMREIIEALRSPILIVSFSDEGYLPRIELEEMLRTRGEVVVIANDYKRYVGALIGIHNLQGEVVGAKGHVRNTEYLYVCAEEMPDSLRDRTAAPEVLPEPTTRS